MSGIAFATEGIPKSKARHLTALGLAIAELDFYEILMVSDRSCTFSSAMAEPKIAKCLAFDFIPSVAKAMFFYRIADHFY
jgi:hypothetical protein